MAVVTKLVDLCPVRCFDAETGKVLVEPGAAAPPLLPGLLETAAPCGKAGLFVWPSATHPAGPGFFLEVPVYRREDLLVIPEHDALHPGAEPRALVAHEGLAMLLAASGYPAPILIPDFSLSGAQFDSADLSFQGITRFLWHSPGVIPVDVALFLPLKDVAAPLARRLPGCFLEREREIHRVCQQKATSVTPPLPRPLPALVPGADRPRNSGILNLTGRHIRFVTPDETRRALGELEPYDDGAYPLLYHPAALTGFIRYHEAYLPVFQRSLSECWASARLMSFLSMGAESPALLVPDDVAAYLTTTASGAIYSLGPEWTVCHPNRACFVEATCLFRWK